MSVPSGGAGATVHALGEAKGYVVEQHGTASLPGSFAKRLPELSPQARLVIPQQALGGATGYVQLYSPGGTVQSGDRGALLPVTAATRAVAAGTQSGLLRERHGQGDAGEDVHRARRHGRGLAGGAAADRPRQHALAPAARARAGLPRRHRARRGPGPAGLPGGAAPRPAAHGGRRRGGANAGSRPPHRGPGRGRARPPRAQLQHDALGAARTHVWPSASSSATPRTSCARR